MVPARGTRSKARRWLARGTLITTGGILVLVALAPVPGAIFLSAYTAAILAAGWGLKCLHGSAPMHDTLDGLYGVIEGLNQRVAELLARSPAPEPQRPELYVVQPPR